MRMLKKFFIGKNIFKVINSTAIALAVLSVQSTCVWVHHQPIVTESLKKRLEYESTNK